MLAFSPILMFSYQMLTKKNLQQLMVAINDMKNVLSNYKNVLLNYKLSVCPTFFFRLNTCSLRQIMFIICQSICASLQITCFSHQSHHLRTYP